LARFARLGASLARSDAAADPVADSFAKLSDVSSAKSDDDDETTQWSIVNDLKRRIIHFKTRESPTEKTLDLSRLDFSCSRPARVIDVNTPASGDLSGKFMDYSAELNAGLVNKSLATGFAHLPPETIERTSRYPDSAVCRRRAAQ
jgi:penicillin V acylase-like amidase (Ntn superfamily)